MAIPGRVLLLTALQKEFDAVARQVAERVEEVHPQGTVYARGRIGGSEVLLGLVGAGNTAAAQETERAISYFEPQVAIFIGVAGGIKDVDLGDVVASTKVYGYESGADRQTFEPRPDVGLSSYPLVQLAMAVAREGAWRQRILLPDDLPPSKAEPKAFVAPIAAGQKVVKETEGAVARFLRSSYGGAVAVEMEGSGFLRAAYASSVDALVVRGISDLLSGKDAADREGSQERAAAHAAAFAVELLVRYVSRFFGQSRGAPPPTPDSGGTPQAAPTTESAVGGGMPPPAPLDVWGRFGDLAPRLYPMGPRERDVWSRAGGDPSRLDLSPGDGRTQWSRALVTLRHGGGGNGLSAASLLSEMAKDFEANLELKALLQAVSENPL